MFYYNFLVMANFVFLSGQIATSSVTSPIPVIPVMSNEVKIEAFNLGGSSVINIWEHGLRLQKKTLMGESTALKPSTIIASISSRMMNLIPQDSSHPLYGDTPENVRMRHSFLLDSMILEKINPANPEMKKESGLAVTNMNDRKMIFKRHQDGKLYINDMLVWKEKELSDGTQLFVVDGIIFSYEADVKEAWQKGQ